MARLAAGESVSGTITLATDPGLTGTLTNTGTVGAEALDFEDADNTSTAAAPVGGPVADLSVTKSGPAAVSSAAAGRVRHRIPQRRTVDGHRRHRHRHPAGRVDSAARRRLHDHRLDRVVCDRVGGSRRHRLDHDHRRRRPGPRARYRVDRRGHHHSNAVGFEDPDPTNNTAELTSTVEALNDVGVTVTANQDEVPAGAPVSYTVVVTNNGPQLASDVVLTNELPAAAARRRALPAVAVRVRLCRSRCRPSASGPGGR